ncbi:MAG: ABC transporter substrate-binding protein, partial [Deltaproteobacteria bacterium]|nr:ABC transporter substrate-binding protein [Deltaproteobacteria bacterium]
DDLFTNDDNADAIVFGNLMDRSVSAQVGRENAAELAYFGANDIGGLEGRNFGVVFCDIQVQNDGEERSDNAIEAARYLIETLGVPAILGPSSSGDTQAVYQAFSDTSTLIISPSATSPALTPLDGENPTDENPGLLWRTAPPDDLQGRAIAADIRAVGSLRSSGTASANIAIIFQSGPYGEGLGTVLSNELDVICPSPTCTVSLNPYDGDTQRNNAVTMIGNDGAVQEVVFISSDVAEVNSFLAAADTITGYDTKQIFLTDSAAQAALEVPAGLEGQIRGSRPKPLETGEFAYGLFRAAYAARFGENPDQLSFTAHSYDAAWMLVYGATWALLQEGSLTGVNIAKGLRQLSSGEMLDVQPTSYNAIRSRFDAGTSVNIEGASGALDYDPAIEETEGPVQIWTVEGGDVISTCDKVAPDGDCVFEP